MSVVSSLCFVVAERSAAIYAAMAGSKYLAKLGDVKGREHILRKDRRRKGKGERLETLSCGDVPLVCLLDCARFNEVPHRGAVRS